MVEENFINRDFETKNERDVSIIKSLQARFKKLFRRTDNGNLFKESIVEMVEEHSGSDNTEISTEEKKILKNVLNFRDSKVSDIMIPRTDIVAIEQNITLEELIKTLINEEHTRMPVYKDSLDNVVGFVHIKDMIPILVNKKPFEIEKITRELLVISPTMKNSDLLAKMRLSRVHMALILDEYGGTDGLVTLEDLVEEIFGDIKDEHDDAIEPEFIRLDEDTIEANARLEIAKLEKLLGKTIEDKEDTDFDTIGGLLLSIVGYVPVKGEKIYHPSGIEFEILDSDPRRVKKILIRKINAPQDI
jgi:CBS domain containing-hemolysin-like protein